MNREQKYTVSHKTKDHNEILIRTFEGEISIKQIIKTIEKDLRDGLISSNQKGVINDYISCEIIGNPEDIEGFAILFDKHINLFKNLKWALVINSPMVAFAMLFNKRHPIYKVKTFNTIDSAISWAKY